MQRTLTFVPVTTAERLAVADGAALDDRRAFVVTDELLAALDYGPDHTEDAEYAAMVIASVAGLADFAERVVLVAEVDPAGLSAPVDADNGEVALRSLGAADVVAFFTDEPSAPVAAAAEASRGLGVDDAWETGAVQDLLAASDMLWHGAEELATTDEEG